MGIVISALVTFWVGFLIYKKYKPQPVLFLGGMILMYIAVLCGYGTILPEKASTGSWFFDAFEFMRKTMSSNAAGLGLNIMSVGAFARYMDRIGASRSLVRLTIKPLLALKSPYLVLSGTWVVGMLIGLCINSASGLAMLLMVTMFPILIGLGVSRLAATAAVASTLCFDWSPSDTGTILSATTAGVDPVLYWTNYQVPIVMVAFVVVGALHYFTQKYMDKRMGHVVKPMEVEKAEENPADSAPLWYAVLPVIPLSLILSFSSIVMGSGNAPFFAFAALTPAVAAHTGLHPVLMLLPMHFAASIARTCSPITAVIVVSSGMGNVSSFDLVKRTFIPMCGALAVTLGMTFYYYYAGI